MVIAVDFDGTLFEEAYPEVGAPKWDIINYCKHRKAMGDTLILWTCRARKRLKMAIRACKEVGLEFDYINNHTKESLKRYGRARKGCKILADVYIDDKAINPKELENDLFQNG